MKGLEKLYNTDCTKVFRFAKKYLLLCVLFPSVIFHSYFLLHHFPVCWLSPLPSYTPHNSNGKLRNFPFGNFHCRVLLSNFTEWFKFPRTLPAWLAGPGLYNWYVGRLVSRINTTTQHTRNTVSWGRHSYTEAQLISWSLVLIAYQMATYG